LIQGVRHTNLASEMKFWCIALGALLVAGCAAVTSRRGSEPNCPETRATLPIDQSIASLAGSYRLTLVAKTGPQRGQSTTGWLTLVTTDSADRSTDPKFSQIEPVRYSKAFMPYYGFARLDLSAVGASADRDITSTDPIFPGALVTDYRATDPDTRQPWREVEVALGGSNRRDGVVETGWGVATTLHLRELARGGFHGSWHSGNSATVIGFFCAFPLHTQKQRQDA
jgi:hypothetical protein